MPCALPIRSEEHTFELQSPCNLVCRLLLEKTEERCVASGRVPALRQRKSSSRHSSGLFCKEGGYPPSGNERAVRDTLQVCFAKRPGRQRCRVRPAGSGQRDAEPPRPARVAGPPPHQTSASLAPAAPNPSCTAPDSCRA